MQSWCQYLQLRAIIINVHTWTAVFSWHLANMSITASIRAFTEHISGPFLRACKLLPCPTRCITVQVSPQRLLLSGWLLTNVQVNITTAIYDTEHTLIYITLLLLFMFFLHFFHSSGQAGCPPFSLSVTVPIHWNIKSPPASPGRSRVGPALYVFSLLGAFQAAVGRVIQSARYLESPR